MNEGNLKPETLLPKLEIQMELPKLMGKMEEIDEKIRTLQSERDQLDAHIKELQRQLSNFPETKI